MEVEDSVWGNTPGGKSSQDKRASREDREASHNVVDEGLVERVHDSESNVAPGTVNGVLVTVTELGQSEGHSEEDGGLESCTVSYAYTILRTTLRTCS